MTPEISPLEAYWHAQDPYDPDALSKLRHPGWHALWPQSGEKVPSHEADVWINANYPGYPEHDSIDAVGHGEDWLTGSAFLPGLPGRRIHISGGGNLWFGEARLAYPDGIWYAVVLADIIGGLIAKETVWWAPEMDPPAWRSRWSSHIDWTGLSVFEDTTSTPSQQRSRERAIRTFYNTVASSPESAHGQLLAPDAVQLFPQTGEVIRGRNDIQSAFLANPESPKFELADLWVVGSAAMVVLKSQDLSSSDSSVVVVIHFGGDRVSRIAEYLAPSLPAPEWRAQRVEKI